MRSLRQQHRDLAARVLFIFVLSLLSVRSPSAGAQELKKVRMGYPAFSLTFLTFFVAKDAGIFKKHGLDVDLVQLAGAVQTSALVSGEIDYLTGITGPLVAAARGLPFKGIMVTHDRTLFWLIASPDIRRAEDLVGKTVAVDRLATLQDIVARDLIKRKGVNPDLVTYIQTGSVSNSVQSLSQGSVAAAVLSLPHNVMMLQKGYREIASAPEFNMRSASGGIAIHDAKLKKDPAGVKDGDSRGLRSDGFQPERKNLDGQLYPEQVEGFSEGRRGILQGLAQRLHHRRQDSDQRFAGDLRSSLRSKIDSHAGAGGAGDGLHAHR